MDAGSAAQLWRIDATGARVLTGGVEVLTDGAGVGMIETARARAP